MKLINISDEDFVNFKLPSMFLIFPYCSFKCCKEAGYDICQNYSLKESKTVDISIQNLYQRYAANPITEAIVCGGLEPFDSWGDLKDFITYFRSVCNDPIVIYTGYRKDEIIMEIKWLKQFENIYLKIGRIASDIKPHYDNVLGVTLMSDNQYGLGINLND